MTGEIKYRNQWETGVAERPVWRRRRCPRWRSRRSRRRLPPPRALWACTSPARTSQTPARAEGKAGDCQEGKTSVNTSLNRIPQSNCPQPAVIKISPVLSWLFTLELKRVLVAIIRPLAFAVKRAGEPTNSCQDCAKIQTDTSSCVLNQCACLFTYVLPSVLFGYNPRYNARVL